MSKQYKLGKESGQMKETKNKLNPDAFENLLHLSYDPLYVDLAQGEQKKKNVFPSVFSALLNAQKNSVIKINQGLYSQILELKIPNVRLQANEPSNNVVIANDQFPSVTVDMPHEYDKVYMESIKFAHLCEQSKFLIRWPSLKELKQTKYRKLPVGGNINTNIIVRRGVLQMDECRLSLAAQKDFTRLNACIIVEEQGTLVMNRSQIIGAAGTIGIFCKGGKIIIRQCSIKEHGGIGILVNGTKKASIILKNSIISKCNEGVVLNGPFASSIQNNVIHQSQTVGVFILHGNSSNIINNEIRQCKTGLEIQNSCPSVVKNIISHNIEYGVCSHSRMNNQSWPLIKFNTIQQNKKGGIMVSGSRNKSQILNNIIRHNNLVGIMVINKANPHLLLNLIANTLGNGIHICAKSTAFVQKNQIIGSLNCNIVLEGPGNIENYIYNNKINGARGNGVFIIDSERFLVAKNEIVNNFNGILSSTSVVSIEENEIANNKCNGIMMIADNQIQISENQIRQNKMGGIVCRNESRARITQNVFEDNKFELVIENDHPFMRSVEADNQFMRDDYDIRIPQNYQCSIM